MRASVFGIVGMLAVMSIGQEAIYDRSKAFWSNWPRSATTRIEVADGRSRVDFIADAPGENPTVYTYVDAEPGRSYRIGYQVVTEQVVRTPNGTSCLSLDFLTKEGYRSGQPGMEWPVVLPDSGVVSVIREFTVPEGIPRVRLHPLALKGMGGRFAIRGLTVVSVDDEVTVARSDAPVKVDGVLDEPVWRRSGRLEGFYIYGSPELLGQGTVAQLAFDEAALYLAVRCEEPEMGALKRNVARRDGDVWCDDGVELFVASPNNRAAQFIFNTLGTQFDAEISQPVPGSPWKNDRGWNGRWECAVKTDADGWTAEVAIPLENFDAKPSGIWRLNLVRDRRAGAGRGCSAQWNLHSGALNNVDHFATLELGEWMGRLTRFREHFEGDPLAVERANPLFEGLPTRAGGHYGVYGGGGSYLLSAYGDAFRKEHEATWGSEQAKMLEELGASMDTAPVGYPWAEKIFGGREATEALLRKHNWKFTGVTHHTGQDREAIADGAAFVRDRFVDMADPLRHARTMKWTRESYGRDAWVVPYLAFIRGSDEPTNTTYDTFSRIKNTGHLDALQQVEDEIRMGFGYKKVGLYDHFASNSDPEAPFRRIAFMRWWNHRVIGYLAEERELLRKVAPGVPFMPVTFNTVSTFRDIEVFPDYVPVGEMHSVDPYPTATFSSCGRERALYHTGFTTRMLHDMTPGTRNHVYIQAFNYWGRAPLKENMREWASQALKNGADDITWYADGNRGNAPGCYEEMLRLSKIIRAMAPLALPEKSPVGLLYSYISHWGNFDSTQNGEYTLYAILGEGLHGNFRFVTDVELDDGRVAASDYRLLIAPHLKYTTEATQKRLAGFAAQGGTLLILDPEAFAFCDNGTPATQARTTLCNAPMPTEKMEAGKIAWGSWQLKVEAAYRLPLPSDATLLASYPDGSPAAYSRPHGNGTVILLAARPFVTAKQALAPGDWKPFFADILTRHGETLNHRHWDFLLP